VGPVLRLHGGRPILEQFPPTEAQPQRLCAGETAAIARSWGLGSADITIEKVMNATPRRPPTADGRSMHDNLRPGDLGGSGERWDFLQLSKNARPSVADALEAKTHSGLSGSSQA